MHHAYPDLEAELSQALGQEEVVGEGSSHLHDSDDGCVHLVLPVLEHTLVGRHILLNLQMRKH